MVKVGVVGQRCENGRLSDECTMMVLKNDALVHARIEKCNKKHDAIVTAKSVAERLRELKFHHVECLNCPYRDYWEPKGGCCEKPCLFYFIDRSHIEQLAKLYEDAK